HPILLPSTGSPFRPLSRGVRGRGGFGLTGGAPTEARRAAPHPPGQDAGRCGDATMPAAPLQEWNHRRMQKWGLCCVALLLLFAGSASAAGDGGWEQAHVRAFTIHYRTHDGYRRAAYVVLPGWYGRGHKPPLPLVLSAD